jgi:subtilisin-like proprotein convertase family protein
MAIPTDPLFVRQWHLQNTGQLGGSQSYDLNVTGVWDDYTGLGVTVGVIDSGVDHRHADLAARYDHQIDYDANDRDDDAAPGDSQDAHGTAVAGLIAAEAGNGVGGVGVAPGATIAGFRALDNGGPAEAVAEAMRHQINVDVSNNSWGTRALFGDNFNADTYRPVAEAMTEVVANGRDGLGTVLVFSASNSAEQGNNVNYHNITSSRFGIAVGAVQADGTISHYSTPGAAVLVSGFGSGIPGNVVTTDISGSGGYDPGDFTESFNGTSAAAPMVSGVVALMLEANPQLGYRDVQEILAYSARQTTPASDGWQTNGAHDFNGGGLHVSHQFGFGLVDAHAAVRLAETWGESHTWWNEVHLTATSSPGAAIPDAGSLDDAMTVQAAQPLRIDHVEVDLDITHSWIGDLTVTLTSPTGTYSTLIAEPGVSAETPDGIQGEGGIRFTTTSTQHWGENADGTWRLTVTDSQGNDVGVLQSWTLRLYGDPNTGDDRYVFTDEYAAAAAADPTRTLLSDVGGIDTVNAAAVTSDMWIDLRPGTTSWIAGVATAVDAGTVIEGAVGGDGADTIVGNASNNLVCGGRGSDVLYGDTGLDQFVFMPGCGVDAVMDFTLGSQGDLIDLRAFGFGDFSALGGSVYDIAGGAVIGLTSTDAVVLAGVQAAQIHPDHILL